MLKKYTTCSYVECVLLQYHIFVDTNGAAGPEA